MSQTDAQSKAQSARRAEGQQTDVKSDRDSQSGIRGASGQLGDLDQRIDRALGAGSVVGGILTRMVADKIERIREVDECLEWYAREREKRETELAELQALVSQTLMDVDLT